MEIKKFEVGKKYKRFNVVFEVVKRTACFVTVKHRSMFGTEMLTRSKVYTEENTEYFCYTDSMLVRATNEL